MILILSLAMALLFMAGIYLILKPNLIRVVAGMVLISNSANLFIMTAAVTRGRAPFLPIQNGEEVSDPVVQSMTLTAVVISFGVSALLLAIVYRVYLSHHTVDIANLSEHEIDLLDATPATREVVDDDRERG